MPSLTAQERPRVVRPGAGQGGGTSRAREPVQDIVRINTRVVFLDALVKDRKTNEPVRDLSPENFQVLDNGHPRRLSYFTREGDSRRPLAMLLFIDLWSMYGRPHLKNADAMRRFASALTKLAPEDEVAVMTTWIEEGETPDTPAPKVLMVEDFTRDRSKTTAALASVPELIKTQERMLEEMARKRSADSGDLRLDVIWRLSDLADRIIPLSARFPQSQFVVVGLHDDLFDLRKGEREKTSERALRAGITFDALVFTKSFGAKLFFGTINKLFMNPRGLSVHAADYIAEQTGGEVVSVSKSEDMAAGLERFIDSLTARYNLGFTLGEHEQDDGRMHKLRVKVRTRKGKSDERHLVVSARRGYYMSAIK